MSYTSFELVLGESPVAEIILNRPEKRNALSTVFWEEFPKAIAEVDGKVHVRALIIRSEGPHFSAGMDLSFFATVDARKAEEEGRFREWLRREILRLQDALTVLETIRVPVISAVQGACLGGALDLVCATNLRYATRDAYFCIHEINIGMTADLGTLQRLPKLMPVGYVQEMALTGSKMPADDAARLGFVTAVCETQDDLLVHVRAVANTIAEKSPLAIAGTKVALTKARDQSVREGLEHMAAWNAAMFVSEDLPLGMKAQQQKKAAHYRDILPLKEE